MESRGGNIDKRAKDRLTIARRSVSASVILVIIVVKLIIAAETV